MSLLPDREFLKKALCTTFLVSSAYTFATAPGFRSWKGAVASPVVGAATTAGLAVGTVKGAVVSAYVGAGNESIGERFMGAVTGVVKGGVQGAVFSGSSAHNFTTQEMTKKLGIDVTPAP